MCTGQDSFVPPTPLFVSSHPYPTILSTFFTPTYSTQPLSIGPPNTSQCTQHLPVHPTPPSPPNTSQSIQHLSVHWTIPISPFTTTPYPTPPFYTIPTHLLLQMEPLIKESTIRLAEKVKVLADKGETVDVQRWPNVSVHCSWFCSFCNIRAPCSSSVCDSMHTYVCSPRHCFCCKVHPVVCFNCVASVIYYYFTMQSMLSSLSDSYVL